MLSNVAGSLECSVPLDGVTAGIRGRLHRCERRGFLGIPNVEIFRSVRGRDIGYRSGQWERHDAALQLLPVG